MKITLPSFAAFALIATLSFAQSPPAERSAFSDQRSALDAAPAPQPADSADNVVQRIASNFKQLPSMAARVHFHVELFGQQTDGKGIYLQQGLGDQRQFRLELQTAIGQNADGPIMVSLVQVCDGKFLWEYQQAPEKTRGSDKPERPTVNKVDMQRIRQALQQGKRHLPAEVVSEFALGGLPRLLDELQNSFRFTSAVADHLDFANPQSNQPETLPVWAIAGVWRPEALREMSPELADQAAAGQPLNLNKLPAQVPEEVVLFVGQDDLFPYRIEYRRRVAKAGKDANAGAGEMLPILTLNFFEVQLAVPIDRHQFEYAPGGAQVADTTASVIKELEGKK